MQDRIEKSVELKAPTSRVWRALTDHEEFGEWFRVKLDGPFVVGEVSRGITTYPGYEGMKWEATVVAMERERLFAFKWSPYEHDDDRDPASAPQTLVEFRLEPTSNGTRLVISESGFDKLPDDARRADALRSNTQGWTIQAKNIAAHVELPPK
jgi:uncharacterized protein YndB with AHSA1/START domain